MSTTTTPTIKGSLGQNLKSCMAILCPEEKRSTCHFHKEWMKERQQVGVYFGTSNCDYYLPMTETLCK